MLLLFTEVLQWDFMTLRMSSEMPPKYLVYFRKFFEPCKNIYLLVIRCLLKLVCLLSFRKWQKVCGVDAYFRRNAIF
ncbi:Uncharacterised protein [Porphyromonas cangingivalis]|nr:Uncharacterised protein [Porphyromonas cangingivalis]